MRVHASLKAELQKSTERFKASRVVLDDLKAHLSALEAESGGIEAQSASGKAPIEETVHWQLRDKSSPDEPKRRPR